MRTIYIIDIIGRHSGAHYYNKRLKDTLGLKYKNTIILSNYSDRSDAEKPLLINFFEGNTFAKVSGFVYSLLRYYLFIARHTDDYFIFLSYGNASESFFAWPLIFCRKKIVDAHEVISLISGGSINNFARRSFAGLLYNHIADAVILHSARSEELINGLRFKKKRIFIPHFTYDTEKEYDERKIPAEVRSLILENRVNILFFGYMRLSKGIDHIIKTAENIAGTVTGSSINLIVAGNDPKGLVVSLLKSTGKDVSDVLSCLLRYISDDELRYLFTRADYVIIPYTQISQSGVLEMAVHFRKPLITSSLDYFREFLDRYPSFGMCFPNDPGSLVTLLEKIIRNSRNKTDNYYTTDDIRRYLSDKDPESFLKELQTVFPDEAD
ncbi:MAG: hypothetical protein MUE74_05400 [Bacteroidales bacterium]|nr:hypothetical protein [Bacteroidales bacterium]